MDEGIQALNDLLAHHDWYHQTLMNTHRYVVYVHRMGPGIEDAIPNIVLGRQVLVHFSDPVWAGKERFIDVQRPWLSISHPTTTIELEPPATTVVEEESPLINGSTELIHELGRLKKICGHNILETIFYEKHDGPNSITDLSNKFPAIRDTINVLYQKYGFDNIYHQL